MSVESERTMSISTDDVDMVVSEGSVDADTDEGSPLLDFASISLQNPTSSSEEPMDTVNAVPNSDLLSETPPSYVQQNTRRKELSIRLKANDDQAPCSVSEQRKSKRINEMEDELPKIADEAEKYQDQRRVVPKGLDRTPFQFAKKEVNRLNLEITMEDRKDKALTMKTNPKICVGEEYQAIIPELETGLDTHVDKKPETGSNTEEEQFVLWIPPTSKQIQSALEKIKLQGKCLESIEESENLFYTLVTDVYWRAIWRQFEGHIPYETALQHLKGNDYNFLTSLETIDKLLPQLPQRMKPLSVYQVERLATLLETKKVSVRQIQEKSMRNYFLEEIPNYVYHFHRVYNLRLVVMPCNCDYFICFHVDFEPRYGCKNCTKFFRNTEHMESTKLCLICQTYSLLANEVRPTKDDLFLASEKLIIAKWKEEEEKCGIELSREELEEMLQEDKNVRWRDMQLTEEEKDMVDRSLLKTHRGQSKIPLSPEELKERGHKLAAQLQPFPIPHLTICRCAETKANQEISQNSSSYLVPWFMPKPLPCQNSLEDQEQEKKHDLKSSDDSEEENGFEEEEDSEQDDTWKERICQKEPGEEGDFF